MSATTGTRRRPGDRRVVQRVAAAGRLGRPGAAPPAAVRRARRQPAILIVEDNKDLAATYRTLLEHHVTVVHTGADAVTATEAHLFDVVLPCFRRFRSGRFPECADRLIERASAGTRIS